MSTKTAKCEICGGGNALRALSNFSAGTEWMICLGCYQRADALAAEEGRWANEHDFERLKREAA